MKNGNQQATNPPRKIYKTIKINNKVTSIIYILTIYHLTNKSRSSVITTRINVIILKIMN